MRRTLTALGAAALLLTGAPAAAAPADVAGAVANPDRSGFDTGLDEARQPVRVLEFLGLERGDDAIDMLAGSGYYTEIMARAVGPEGHVIGHNPPGVIDRFNLGPVFAARDYGGRIANAEELNVIFGELELEPESLDFALFHIVMHDMWFERVPDLPRVEPATVLAELYAAMRPGGVVGVVDHVGTDAANPRDEVARLHRISPDIVRAAMAEAGFVFDGESDMFRNPEDDHRLNVFDPAIRGRTDRIVYRFVKPER
jgi:predicted methyltransferase